MIDSSNLGRLGDCLYELLGLEVAVAADTAYINGAVLFDIDGCISLVLDALDYFAAGADYLADKLRVNLDGYQFRGIDA